MALSLVTPPAAEPITVAEAKLHARIDHAEEDALVGEFIAGAREVFEEGTGRQLVTATWRLSLDRFPRGREPIRIPKPPLQSVTLVKYIDTAGVEQTWAATEYGVLAPAGPFAGPGLLYPKPFKVWPSTFSGPGAVTVEFKAGYASVPMGAKDAIYQIAADLYLNREAQIVGSITSPNRTFGQMLAPFRVPVYA